MIYSALRFALCALIFQGVVISNAHADKQTDGWSAYQIIEESFQRHRLYPYVFEEQTMILMDEHGNHDVRGVRRFSRIEKDGAAMFLLVFDHPEEIRGVALLAKKDKGKSGRSWLYLPAFGKQLKANGGSQGSHRFLGTDFTINNLTPVNFNDYHYQRQPDYREGESQYYMISVFPNNKDIEKSTGYSRREYMVRQDNLFIVRTDYFDRQGRFFKRQSIHDLQQVNGDMWRANMVLMEDFRQKHKTLIKIESRVFSHDYVPPHIFTSSWLLSNQHMKNSETFLLHQTQAEGKVTRNK